MYNNIYYDVPRLYLGTTYSITIIYIIKMKICLLVTAPIEKDELIKIYIYIQNEVFPERKIGKNNAKFPNSEKFVGLFSMGISYINGCHILHNINII